MGGDVQLSWTIRFQELESEIFTVGGYEAWEQNRCEYVLYVP